MVAPSFKAVKKTSFSSMTSLLASHMALEQDDGCVNGNGVDEQQLSHAPELGMCSAQVALAKRSMGRTSFSPFLIRGKDIIQLIPDKREGHHSAYS